MSEEDEELRALLNEVGRSEYTGGLSVAAKQLEKVQNAMVRLLRKYGCVDIENLSLEQKERLRREVAHCALLLLISFPAIWRYFSAQSRPLLQLELESLIRLGWSEFWEEQNSRPPRRKEKKAAKAAKGASNGRLPTPPTRTRPTRKPGASNAESLPTIPVHMPNPQGRDGEVEGEAERGSRRCDTINLQ